MYLVVQIGKNWCQLILKLIKNKLMIKAQTSFSRNHQVIKFTTVQILNRTANKETTQS